MGRRQEFDTGDALDAALQVFWTKGYRATSMADLEAATGLNPGSLYNTFGSKQGLFLAVVDYYIERTVGHRIATILNIGPPLDAIEAFFRTAYEDIEPDGLIGCLLTNTAAEIGREEAEIRDRVAAGIGRIEAAFRARLSEAQEAGALSTDKDAAVLAVHLTASYQGASVIGRLSRDKRRLKAVADAALLPLR